MLTPSEIDAIAKRLDAANQEVEQTGLPGEAVRVALAHAAGDLAALLAEVRRLSEETKPVEDADVLRVLAWLKAAEARADFEADNGYNFRNVADLIERLSEERRNLRPREVSDEEWHAFQVHYEHGMAASDLLRLLGLHRASAPADKP